MIPIRSHFLVACDIKEALDHFRSVDQRLADVFEDHFNVAFARMVVNPYQYGESEGGYRHCPIHRFPYSILYSIYSDFVWVRAVAHESRKPGSFDRRNP